MSKKTEKEFVDRMLYVLKAPIIVFKGQEDTVTEEMKMPCPDCGSTTIMHYDWCRIHNTPLKGEKAKNAKDENPSIFITTNLRDKGFL